MTAPEVAGLIRSRRLAAGLTQSALARTIKASDAHISRWERGVFAPSARYARKLAEVLGGDLGDYLPAGEE